MIGKVVKGYLLESQIAVTTTGVVYRIQDAVLGVSRALKVLHPALAEKKVIRERFRLATSAWAKLDNACFAYIFETIEESNFVGVVMDLISGPSLRSLLDDQKTLSVSQAVDYFLQMAKGLLVAHKQNILHRKLAPENIKICKGEKVKILGTGALRAADMPKVTPANFCLGKVHYMPPEQFSGIYSIHTDQYTMGAIFYEMVTGEPPYQSGNVAELYKMHLTNQPVLPRKFNSSVSRNLQSIILKMLAKKPENRFDSLEEVIAVVNDATDRIDVSQDNSLHALMYRGRRSLERRNFENSIYFFNKVLSDYGENSPVYQEALEQRRRSYLLRNEEDDIRKIRELTLEALDCYDEEDFTQTELYLQKILKIMKGYPASSRMRGLLMDIRREMPEIEKRVSSDLQKQKIRCEWLVQQAQIQIEKNHLEEAEELLTEALIYDQNQAVVLTRSSVRKRISLRRYACKYVSAVSAYRQADYVQAIRLLEEINQEQKEDEKSALLLSLAREKQKKQEIKKQKIEKIFREANHLYEKWKYDDALNMFQKVLDLEPEHVEAKKFLQELHERLYDDHQMENIAFFFSQGKQFFEQKKWQESITCFDRVLEPMPTHKKALEYKQSAQVALEKENLFQKVFKEALLLFEKNDYNAALVKFDYLAELEKDHSEVLKYRRLCREFAR